jgi:predicted nicotinamide N-methyase
MEAWRNSSHKPPLETSQHHSIRYLLSWPQEMTLLSVVHRAKQTGIFFLIFCIVQFYNVASFSLPSPPRDLLTTYILVDGDGSRSTSCSEMAPYPAEADKKDEGEVEMLFPTRQRYFGGFADYNNLGTVVNDNHNLPLVTVRRTSFACGKMGYTVWEASIAMCLYFASCPDKIMGKRIMELGAGIGLPSVVFRDVLGAESVLATDFWRLGEEEFDKARLVPDKWHGMNLEYNVQQQGKKGARVQRLDWHNPDSIGFAKAFNADLIVGSDLVYYPSDIQPLWNTIKTLMDGEVGAKEVILFSPLPPVTREALPEFRDFLEKEATKDFHVEMEEYTMFQNEIGEDGESFLRMTIAKR